MLGAEPSLQVTVHNGVKPSESNLSRDDARFKQ